MFWDHAAGVYDLFVNVVNRRTHKALREIVSGLIGPEDDVLECACGTGLLTSVIAGKCKKLTATDFSRKMLGKAEKNCAAYRNISFRLADITALDFPDGRFDAAVAGNVIHLLDEPLKALGELDRVTKPGGTLIIPTYMNRNERGRTSAFASAVGKAGADFKRQFTPGSYRQFFLDAGYRDVRIELADGRIPCAVAVMKKAYQLHKEGDSAMIKTTLKIDGMMCSMCEAHVCDAIRKAVPAAKKVRANCVRGEATFLTEDPVNGAEVGAAVTATGYTSLGVKSAPAVKGLFGWK